MIKKNTKYRSLLFFPNAVFMTLDILAKGVTLSKNAAFESDSRRPVGENSSREGDVDEKSDDVVDGRHQDVNQSGLLLTFSLLLHTYATTRRCVARKG